MNMYSGPQRRFRNRREQKDRREMVRFELDKEPRRSGRDRRESLELWKGQRL